MQLIVVWQDVSSRRWYPVARVGQEHGEYWFRYTRAAAELNARFGYINNMTDLDREYRSFELFSFLQNRLFNKSRADLPRYLERIGLERDSANDPLQELAASGGPRATDPFQLILVPENTDGRYRLPFFVHGMRHTAESQLERAAELSAGERLFIQRDVQNRDDNRAYSLRTAEPQALVGYLPRIISDDLEQLLNANGFGKVTVSVLSNIRDAPPRMRLRCSLESPWPAGFKPFATEPFQALATTRPPARVVA